MDRSEVLAAPRIEVTMIEHAEEGMRHLKSDADQLGWKDKGEGRRQPQKRCRSQLTGGLERCSWTSLLCLLVAAHQFSRQGHSTIAFTPCTTHFYRTREQISSKPLLAATISAGEGLSRYYQNILSRTSEQQRFVTGKYPVIVTVVENPTRKWLDKSAATSQLLANGTSIDRSVASYDRFQWLAKGEREELHNRYATASLQLLAEIHMTKPGYVNILPSDGAGSSAAVLRHADATTPLWNRWNRNSILFEQLEDLKWQGPYRDRLWVSGFTLAGRRGIVKSVDIDNGHIDSVNSRSESMALWPNEVCSVPAQLLAPPHHSETKVNSNFMDDALLVSDGFLVPGKDRGGVYVIKNPGNPHSEWTTCLTDQSDRWFYHRAVWVDLTGDGRMSILTARAMLRKEATATSQSGSSVASSRPKNGQLIWLECPKPFQFDAKSGTPLEEDGTRFDPLSARHVPWKERVLATGPDVMFSVADLDTNDDTVEVIASQFFDKKVTLHSIRRCASPKVTFSRVIDNRCGSAFGAILADLDSRNCALDRQVLDSGSTVKSLKTGDSFSHVLVTSHECNYADKETEEAAHRDENLYQSTSSAKSYSLVGGSLFAYRVPEGVGAWKTEPWFRTTVATGFKVKPQIWNVINPGAPGFVYTFHAKKLDAICSGKRPMIAVAGDCAESAYLFRPDRTYMESGMEEHNGPVQPFDAAAQYKLMCEIKCGATVGSIGIGYEDLVSAEQESGYAKIYVPCYEKDKILVFAMGSGMDADNDDGW